MSKRDGRFDELLDSYYGRGPIPGDTTFDALLASYYGTPGVTKLTSSSGATVVLSLSADDGEVLSQLSDGASPAEEYVVDGAMPVPAAEEYVVPLPAPARVAAEPSAPPPTVVPAVTAAPTPPVSPPPAPTPPATDSVVPTRVAEERELDVLRPLAQAVRPAEASPSSVQSGNHDRGAAEVTDDDLAADMEAILSGKKVFDPSTKRTVEPEELSSPASRSARQTPEVENAQGIFDRIAQSMQYANAYDLGTVELENRFADFDRAAEERDNVRASAPRPALIADPRPAPMTGAAAPVGPAEFIQDLEEIRGHQVAVPRAAHQPTALTPPPTRAHDEHACCGPASLSPPPRDDLSRPLYDAGEHARAGGDLYVDRLRVGRQPGVLFSYGHLLAMADLYESVDQMMGAEVSELSTLKGHLDRSIAFYQGNRTNRSLDVSHKQWNDATRGRYFELADVNYAHFSPNTLLTDATSRAATMHPNNKTTWQAHHARAIEEMQTVLLAPENAARTPFPEWPLIINAFGDHFLTDAFASGHLINKEVMIALFKERFFSRPGKLNPGGRAFFTRVADAAFAWANRGPDGRVRPGEVRQRFSELETVDYPVCAWGWCFKWRPNIDTANAFQELLVQAAEQEPEKVGNFVVKALHDRLNEDGVEVTNQAGDPPWTLMGDGHLNETSLNVMRKAVQQSVDNLEDPSIRAGNLNFGPYFDKVWQYVPQPTAASAQRIAALVREYTDPASTVLSGAAARIITEQVDSLISELIKLKKLKPA